QVRFQVAQRSVEKATNRSRRSTRIEEGSLEVEVVVAARLASLHESPELAVLLVAGRGMTKLEVDAFPRNAKAASPCPMRPTEAVIIDRLHAALPLWTNP